jgi:hypothetical protein
MRNETIAIGGRMVHAALSIAALEHSPAASSVVGYQSARYPAAMTTQNTNITRTATAAGGASVPKAVAWAAAIALIVTVSLLAVSGFDPFGLAATAVAQTQQPLNPVGGQPGGPPVTPKPGGPLTPYDTTYKVDAIEFLLTPDQFVEYKFRLKTGAMMVFNWKASAPVAVDFHTVPDGKPISASETYMRGTASKGQGTYRAPYPGLHGWYWKNEGKENVTIVLNASGFWTEARMFSGDPVGEVMDLNDPPPPE